MKQIKRGNVAGFILGALGHTRYSKTPAKLRRHLAILRKAGVPGK